MFLPQKSTPRSIILWWFTIMITPQNMVLVAKGGPDKRWTWNPTFVQVLSSVCPNFVQPLSKYRVCPVPVQEKSIVCQNLVQDLSIFKHLGQGLDTQVQCLSSSCPVEGQKFLFHWLDKLWTNIVWPDTIFGQFLVGQTLDIDWTWTNMGHSLDMDRLWTKAGYANFAPGNGQL